MELRSTGTAGRHGEWTRYRGPRARRWRAALAIALALLAGALLPATAPAGNLGNNGGSTLSSPAVYIDYWGSDWNGVANFAQYRTYLETFFNNVGGTRFLATQGQYGAGNPSGLLQGTWQDTGNSVPQTPNGGNIAFEAEIAADHFFPPPSSVVVGDTYNPQAIMVIALPPGKGDTTFATKGGPFCAFHNDTVYFSPVYSPVGRIRDVAYINLPYAPDGGKNCFQNWINPTNDNFGHGLFDGVSKLGSHEFAEMITDPFPASGWVDSNGNETGDKCNTQKPPANNIAPASNALGHWFAVQSLWSNAARDGTGGCVLGAAPQAQASQTSIDFGSVRESTTSGATTLNVFNAGDADLHPCTFVVFGCVRGPYPVWSLTGANPNDFHLSGDSCANATVHPITTDFVADCSVNVTFTPTGLGARTATLQMFSDDPSGPVTVSLTGSGTGFSMVVGPTHLSFPGALLASLSTCGLDCGPGLTPLPITFTNNDTSPHMLQGVHLGGEDPGDFLITQDGCSGTTLPAPIPGAGGNSCTVDVAFAPVKTGERTALLLATDEAGNPYAAPLTGTGLGPVAGLSTATLDFDDARVGQTTSPQKVTITNTGQYQMAIDSVAASGDFAETNDCPGSLSAGASCDVQVTLTATHGMYEAGTLTISDNASDSPQEVQLSGIGTLPFAELLPNPLSLGYALVGQTGTPAPVKLTNLGSAPLTLANISTNGDFSQTNNCPTVLEPNGASCTITVSFKPTALGPRTGTLSVSDDAPGSPQTVPLSGTGFAWPASGAFVIGDKTPQAAGASVNFWGAQWAKNNTLSGGSAPTSFKGFADTPSSTPPACNGTYTTDPGNSSGAPAGPLPAYMGVLVSSSLAKSGSTISGNIVHIVVVDSIAGYQNDPGHPGTGTVVGQLC